MTTPEQVAARPDWASSKALAIVDRFSWSSNVMRGGHLIGQQYIVAEAIAEALREAEQRGTADQRATIERLTDALRPFCGPGGCPDMQAFHDIEDDVVVWKNSGAGVTAGDVRNAREVLAKVLGEPVCMMHFRRKPSMLEQDVEKAEANATELKTLLEWLHAMVKGECPSLLNEDSGGSADLALRIEAALSPAPATREEPTDG